MPNSNQAATMPKTNLKESITKLKTKLHRTNNAPKPSLNRNKPEQTPTNTEPTHRKKIQLPKLNLKSKKEQPHRAGSIYIRL
jgi:hypothetical protein